MEYRRFDDDVVVSLVKGEEVLSCLKEIALKENIVLANINGLGATDDFTAGLLNTTTKEYLNKRFTGDHEIVSLTGSINTMNGEYYSHLHIACANEKNEVVGGHLNNCVISGVGEIFIHIIHGKVDREYNEEIGLNVFKF